MRLPVILSFEHWRGGTEIKLIGPSKETCKDIAVEKS